MTRALTSTSHASSGAPFSFVPPNRYHRRPLYNPTLVPAPPKGFIIHKGIESASPIPFHSLAPVPKKIEGKGARLVARKSGMQMPKVRSMIPSIALLRPQVHCNARARRKSGVTCNLYVNYVQRKCRFGRVRDEKGNH
jgi:hypothetical protein